MTEKMADPPEQSKELTPVPLSSNEQAKFDEYVRLGFSEFQAKALVGVHGLYAADVRESYINKGCSVETAWRILRP